MTTEEKRQLYIESILSVLQRLPLENLEDVFDELSAQTILVSKIHGGGR